MNNNINNDMRRQAHRMNRTQRPVNHKQQTPGPRKLKWGRIILIVVIAAWILLSFILGVITEVKWIGGLIFSGDSELDENKDLNDNEKNDLRNITGNEGNYFIDTDNTNVNPNTDDTSSKNKIIVLDAGHGGKDDGASYSGFNEKDINLSICLKVKEILTNKKYDVRLTRSDDTFVEKADRADIANRLGADVFVSFHCNSYTGTGSVSGTEIYYSKLNNSYSCGMKLGEFILNRIVNMADQKDRGVRDYDYAVVKRTKMAAVLIEMGYMTNKHDMDILTTDDGQDKMASSIAEGIIDYIKTL